MSQIPEEDDITKRILWQRIEDLRATTETDRGNANARIDAIKPDLVALTQSMIDETMKIINQKKADFDAAADGFRKDYSAQNEQILKQANDLLVKFTAEIEAKIQELSVHLDITVKQSAADYFFADQKQIQDIQDATTKWANENLEAINKYQTTIQSQVAQINGKFEAILEKFRLIAKTL